MKLKKIAATLSVIGTIASAPAFAVDTPLTFDTSGFPPAPWFAYLQNDFTSAGVFTDNWTFTLTDPGSPFDLYYVTSSLYTFNAPLGKIVTGIKDFSVQLYLGTPGSGSAIGIGALEGTIDNLAAGSYYLAVTGNVVGTNPAKRGSYSGEVNVTPVPEPESYALFLAGLGLMGAIARRRSRA